jgi:PKD domain
MTSRFARFCIFAVALAAGGCTVQQQSAAPPLTGPSGLAVSMIVTAAPDTIKLGQSATSAGESSTVTVQVIGPDGSPLANKGVRLDILVGGTAADCGTLSARDLVTGSDGRAAAKFTAPGLPLPMPDCSGFSPGQTVTIVANVTGSNFQTAVPYTASIRMLAPTVIPAPGGATVSFTIFPNPAKVGADVSFIDAGSFAPAGRRITSYQWDFSDSVSKTGPSVTHDFGVPGLYTATLTVTDDIGQQTSKSATVTVSP